MSSTVSNLLCTEKCKDIVTDGYIEPKNEEIMESFIQATNDTPLPVPASPKKKKVEKNKTDNARHKDIRDFFSWATRQERTKKKNPHGHYIITIDQWCNILYVMIYVRKKNEKITDFLPDFIKVLMLYTVTIDIAERLNCNDLSVQGIGC